MTRRRGGRAWRRGDVVPRRELAVEQPAGGLLQRAEAGERERPADGDAGDAEVGQLRHRRAARPQQDVDRRVDLAHDGGDVRGPGETGRVDDVRTDLDETLEPRHDLAQVRVRVQERLGAGGEHQPPLAFAAAATRSTARSAG
jgi:hypothetical protein